LIAETELGEGSVGDGAATSFVCPSLHEDRWLADLQRKLLELARVEFAEVCSADVVGEIDLWRVEAAEAGSLAGWSAAEYFGA
jgi:hypothetical protein